MTTIVNHDNLVTIQHGWDALAAGDPTAALATMADNIVMENGPLPLPERWIRCEGVDQVVARMSGFDAMFAGTLRQHGTCIHADDRIALSIVRDEALLNAEPYSTDVVAVMRLDRAGRVDRLWFIELDDETLVHHLSAPGS